VCQSLLDVAILALLAYKLGAGRRKTIRKTTYVKTEDVKTYVKTEDVKVTLPAVA
jgi:hypothetical protein